MTNMKRIIALAAVFLATACKEQTVHAPAAQETQHGAGGFGGYYEGDYPGMGGDFGLGGTGGSGGVSTPAPETVVVSDEEQGLYPARGVCDYPPSLCEEPKLVCVAE